MAFTAEELALAEPQKESTIEAWYMDDSEEDQRLPHRRARRSPNKPATLSDLSKLGVTTWQLDADAHETDPKLAAVRKVRGYSYTEIITISKDKLPGYEEKIKSFYEEHIHNDEEIR
ncbi:1,2-dihydroxy-3-keto-5-methylthiopentene dioxygenase [Monoraphidium neglectum]|uniref:acireductone dioxygenase (Fe(2+)-requiring) n=1 Tax=Monoraphidium neglectum TaxID=145388 RepID=A0A0D2M8S5_9CHLO|nr:1,2-dihydroxy-3-keto-5-methylthiopentene dioxygenase [Monoraphidium neglectum]KIY99644.1 1,2-dihydroxy-3-keto-5-methylthiopentene dioxygenase [Monoraphidium neglectum]|eukprot:XP_013898664.1 1,2-dihydroxy-3-keto-5-methylthiopentene dioxygenase [Monoraphidium neglectum]